MLLADCILKVREQENRYPSIMITFILVSLAPDVAGGENLLLEEICPAPRFRDLAPLTQVCKATFLIKRQKKLTCIVLGFIFFRITYVVI
jgi:hypothetical protein